MISIIFEVLLSTLHVIYSAWKFIRCSWKFILRKYKCVKDVKSVEEELKYISASVKRLSKLPAHLAIIVVNERISYSDLANIILWCVAARISSVSFYDHTGVLKRNEMKLRSALLDKWREPSVIWATTPIRNGLEKKNGFANGFSSKSMKNGENPSTLQIFILSSDEGREAITKATRRLCENVKSGKLDVREIDEKLLDKELSLGSKDNFIVDPELAVWCGDTCCNCGFLPWHIRVTQFLQLQTHHEIQTKDFISLLEAYSKCQQRFGK